MGHPVVLVYKSVRLGQKHACERRHPTAPDDFIQLRLDSTLDGGEVDHVEEEEPEECGGCLGANLRDIN